MKKFVIGLLTMCLVSSVSADCIEDYENLITKKLKNKKVTNIVGWSSAGVAGAVGGVTAHAALVAQYGASFGAVFFGTQVGIIAALPIVATVVTVATVNKTRTKNLQKTVDTIKAAQGDTRVSSRSLLWLFKKLKRNYLRLSLDELKVKITDLNQSRALCDGSISKKLLGIKKLRKYLDKNLKDL